MKRQIAMRVCITLAALSWLPPVALAVRTCFCNEIRPACSQYIPQLADDDCFYPTGGDSIYVAIPYIEKGKNDWQPYSSGNCTWKKGTVDEEGDCVPYSQEYENSAPGSQSAGVNCNGICPVQPGG